MIRIDLLQQHKKSPWMVPGLFVAAFLAVVAGAAGLYWVDQQYPLRGVWKELWTPAGEETAPEPRTESGEGTEEVVGAGEKTPPPVVAEEDSMPPPVVAEETEPVAATMSDTAAAEPVPAPPMTQESGSPAGTVPPATEVDSRTAGERRSALRESAACLWVFKVTERLPSSTRLTSLTCKASGEYSLEGVGSSGRDVEGFVKTLQQLPSRVDLTLWREGRLQTNRVYRFIFHGQFEELFLRDLEAMSAVQAQTLVKKIGQWARQSGLNRVSLKGPIDVRLDKGHTQQRHKLWATGSQAQIGDFLRRLKQVEDIATLGEVVIVPVHPEDANRDLARLYIAVDLLVRQP